MTYRPAILLGLLVPLLIWQRSATRAPETTDEAPAPMAATKRPRMAPAAPLRDLADAAARGTRDSLRSWASGLDDEEILDHVQSTLARIAADTTSSKEELFHLRPLLCALAMEGGRRDIESFLSSLDSMEGLGKVVLAYPPSPATPRPIPPMPGSDCWGRAEYCLSLRDPAPMVRRTPIRFFHRLSPREFTPGVRKSQVRYFDFGRSGIRKLRWRPWTNM